jgi:hypothetical protein
MKIRTKWLVAAIGMVSVAAILWPSAPQNSERQITLVDSAPLDVGDSQPSVILSTNEFRQNAVATTQENIVLTEAIREQMADVAHAYEANMRFPTYSKPLSTNDWNLLNPRPFVKKAVPLDFDEALSASIVLDHYIVHRDQELPVEVHISGAQQGQWQVRSVTTHIGNDGDDDEPVQLSLKGEQSGKMVYEGKLPTSLFEDIASGEVPLVADIEFSPNEDARVSAIFKLVGTDATLTDIGQSYVEGAHLVIPATFDVEVSGFYRVQANLFDKATGSPISHINTTFMLNKTDNEGVLKVHAVTLRNQGSIGPYVLRDWNITRGPASPGDKTGYGAASKPTYDIEGFDLEVYDDAEYIDAKNQQRLAFLQRMAGIQ